MPPPKADPGRLKAEQDLNVAFARTFSGPEGEAVLAWLRANTINAVCGPDVTDGQLRHIEGQRWIVGETIRRVELGKQRKPDVP